MQRGWIRDATVLESRSLSACSFQLWFPNPFGTTDWLPGRQFFHRPGEEVEWFGDDSNALHLLGSLFLLLLYRLHLTSSGIRSWKLGIPAIEVGKNVELHKEILLIFMDLLWVLGLP